MTEKFVPIYPYSKTHQIYNDYEVLEELGSGTYSIVKLGQNIKNGEKVAIKCMNKSTDPEELVALTGEIRIMVAIKDAQNIVRLQDVYETKHQIMLVLDLVTGGELFEKIVARGSYSEKDASHALQQMMTALAYMHSKRIIHRDLKPENILCTHSSLELPEDVKIADFGESIQLPPGGYTNELRGSPCYIAPEVWLQENYDMGADMWSVGVISFVLLGGYLPFEEPPPENEEEADELRISEVIIRGEYNFRPDVWGDTSVNAKAFVKKLLTVQRKDRMTAEQALQHPFLSLSSEASTISRDKAIANLKTFNAKRKWKSVAQMVIATNRLKLLSGISKTNHRTESKKRVTKSPSTKKSSSSIQKTTSKKSSSPSLDRSSSKREKTSSTSSSGSSKKQISTSKKT